MNKKVTSKRLSKDLSLRLTTYGPDRGGMIELIDRTVTGVPLPCFAGDVIFEGHFMREDVAKEQYRDLKTKSQAIHWAYVNS